MCSIGPHCNGNAMVTQTLDISGYKLYPSPRNRHREVFGIQLFLPYPYALIVLEDFHFQGKATLYAACREQDGKMGQLVSFELVQDRDKFERLFTPD